MVVCKIKAVKIEQSRYIRSQSTMPKISGLNIEGDLVLACEGGDHREISNTVIVIITNNTQTTLIRLHPSKLPISSQAQTKECHSITFRTQQRLNSWKDTNTIQISIYLSWIPWKHPSISVSSLSRNSPAEMLKLGEKGFSLFKFKFRMCGKCFPIDSMLKTCRSMM